MTDSDLHRSAHAHEKEPVQSYGKSPVEVMNEEMREMKSPIESRLGCGHDVSSLRGKVTASGVETYLGLRGKVETDEWSEGTTWCLECKPMKPPSSLTDAELDEAVARECFGKRSAVVSIGDGTIHGLDNPMAVLNAAELRYFRPTTDACDAERVWDWLRDRSPNAIVRNKVGAVLNADEVHFELQAIPGECVSAKDWKRALCESALQVARRGK